MVTAKNFTFFHYDPTYCSSSEDETEQQQQNARSRSIAADSTESPTDHRPRYIPPSDSDDSDDDIMPRVLYTNQAAGRSPAPGDGTGGNSRSGARDKPGAKSQHQGSRLSDDADGVGHSSDAPQSSTGPRPSPYSAKPLGGAQSTGRSGSREPNGVRQSTEVDPAPSTSIGRRPQPQEASARLGEEDGSVSPAHSAPRSSPTPVSARYPSGVDALSIRSNALNFMNRKRQQHSLDASVEQERHVDGDEEIHLPTPSQQPSGVSAAASAPPSTLKPSPMPEPKTPMRSVSPIPMTPTRLPQEMQPEDIRSPHTEEDLTDATELRSTTGMRDIDSQPRFLADTDSSCRHKRSFDEKTNRYVWFCGCPHHRNDGAEHHRVMSPHNNADQSAVSPRERIEADEDFFQFAPKLNTVSDKLDAVAMEKRMTALATAVMESDYNEPTDEYLFTPSARGGSVTPREKHSFTPSTSRATHRTGSVASAASAGRVRRWELLYGEAAAIRQRKNDKIAESAVRQAVEDRLAMRKSVHNGHVVTDEKFEEMYALHEERIHQRRLQAEEALALRMAPQDGPKVTRQQIDRLATPKRGQSPSASNARPSQMLAKPNMSDGSKHIVERLRDEGKYK